LPFVTALKSNGEAVYLTYPMVRLVIFLASYLNQRRELLLAGRVSGRPH